MIDNQLVRQNVALTRLEQPKKEVMKQEEIVGYSCHYQEPDLSFSFWSIFAPDIIIGAIYMIIRPVLQLTNWFVRHVYADWKQLLRHDVKRAIEARKEVLLVESKQKKHYERIRIREKQICTR